jgi:hypothetical protein
MNEGTEGKRFDKLRIVSSDFTIVYKDDIRATDNTPLDGRIRESEKEIHVRKDICYQRQLQVLLHESMHGLKWEMTFDRTNETDEETINIMLTTGVGCFIRDNPEFIREYLRVFAK